MKILSLATVFPNPHEPGLGLFVRARLREMARVADLVVVAPLPALDYRNLSRRQGRARVAFRRDDDGITVLHPRWFYPPGGTALNSVFLFLRIVLTLARIRRRYRFDVIDAHFGFPEGIAAVMAGRVFRCPCVITLRGNELKFAERPLLGPLLGWALRKATRIITVSDELRDLAIRLSATPTSVKTVPNGVDADLFQPRPREPIRSANNVPDGRLVVLSVGELVERKGHHRTARAVGHAIRNGLDVELWIAGSAGRDGSECEGIIRQVAADMNMEDRVRFLGFVGRRDLVDLLSAADLFCLSSDLEGWPNVVHEALACGVPVVATAVGAVPQMIPDENLGLVTPIGDQPALDEAVDQALRRQWDRPKISAWGRARDWALVGREAVDELRQAIAGPNSRLDRPEEVLESSR